MMNQSRVPTIDALEEQLKDLRKKIDSSGSYYNRNSVEDVAEVGKIYL